MNQASPNVTFELADEVKEMNNDDPKLSNLQIIEEKRESTVKDDDKNDEKTFTLHSDSRNILLNKMKSALVKMVREKQ